MTLGLNDKVSGEPAGDGLLSCKHGEPVSFLIISLREISNPEIRTTLWYTIVDPPFFSGEYTIVETIPFFSGEIPSCGIPSWIHHSSQETYARESSKPRGRDNELEQ